MHGRGHELVDGDGHVDRDQQQAVQPGERPRQREQAQIRPVQWSLEYSGKDVIKFSWKY